MDCVGAICGDNKISFFGVDNDLCVNIYKSYTPSNIQSVTNAINYHPERDQLLCAGTHGINSIDSEISNHTQQDFDFENKPILTNVSCLTSNAQWFGYSTRNTMNVIAWDSRKLVTTKKHKEHFNAISFIANRYIIGGDNKGELLIHNCNSHLLSTTFDGYISQTCINCIDVTKNRINWFIASNDNGFNYLFDITREKLIYYDYTHSSPSNQCSFNPLYSSLFVSCGLDKQVLVHDINRKKIGIKLEAKAPLSCVKYLPGSEKYIICCSTNGDMYLYDLRRFTKPIQEVKTLNCIIGLDVHDTLKYSSLNSVDKEDKEVTELNADLGSLSVTTEEIVNTEAMAIQSQSPISSAVAFLPEYMNKKFGNVKMKQNNAKVDKIEVITIDTNTKKDKAQTAAEQSESKDDDLENKIREIVREEIESSEKRVLKEFGKMIHQLHSDLLEQFCMNEIS
eukprot:276626_1